MKFRAIAIAIVITCFTRVCALAQTPVAPSPQVDGSRAVVVQISRELNVKKLKGNDRITATVLQALISSGKVVIPRNSKLVGRVVEAQATSPADSEARLTVIFERVDLKGGGTMSVHAVIQAVAPPLYDPFLEAIMASSSSPYAGGQNGHPVTGGTSAGQSNVPTPSVGSDPRKSGARALEQREHALEDAGKGARSGPQGPRGALNADSRGVFGFPALSLRSTDSVPVLISAGHNIDLQNGTQVVLRLDGFLLKP